MVARAGGSGRDGLQSATLSTERHGRAEKRRELGECGVAFQVVAPASSRSEKMTLSLSVVGSAPTPAGAAALASTPMVIGGFCLLHTCPICLHDAHAWLALDTRSQTP